MLWYFGKTLVPHDDETTDVIAVRSDYPNGGYKEIVLLEFKGNLYRFVEGKGYYQDSVIDLEGGPMEFEAINDSFIDDVKNQVEWIKMSIDATTARTWAEVDTSQFVYLFGDEAGNAWYVGTQLVAHKDVESDMVWTYFVSATDGAKYLRLYEFKENQYRVARLAKYDANGVNQGTISPLTQFGYSPVVSGYIIEDIQKHAELLKRD